MKTSCRLFPIFALFFASVTGAFALGGLDTTFGTAGKVITDFGSTLDVAADLALQTDGKIVVVGHTGGGGVSRFAVARYGTNGTLDPTFNSTGKVTTAIGSNGSFATGVAMQTDGKIVVAGYTSNGTSLDFAVARYDANGVLDPTFNSTGIVTTDINGSDLAFDVAIQTDGKILVAGQTFNGSANVFALVRYHTDGSLDTGFNSTGMVSTAIGTMNDIAYGLAVQTDGKIVLAGTSDNGPGSSLIAVARFDTNGALDSGFNSTGKVTTAFGTSASATSVKVQSDGAIVVGGASDGNLAVVRYTTAGALDPAFNSTGKVTLSIGTSSTAQGVAVQADGKIDVAGYASLNGTLMFALARFNPNGTLDARITTSIETSDFASALAVQADGRIVVAGTVNNGTNADFAVARYEAAFGTGNFSLDINGDGIPDLVFQNLVGQIYGWFMNGHGQIISGAYLHFNGVGPWRVAGIADMNNDGNADLLFQKAGGQIYVWHMNGSGGVLSGGFLYSTGLGNWRIKALADLNNDNNVDIVFQDKQGKVFVWFMDGNGTATSGQYIFNGKLGDWKIVGAADVNSDGNVDLLFQNDAGAIFVWYLDGNGNTSSGGYLYNGNLGDWRVVVMADVDSDGNVDLVFQNDAGLIFVWHLDGFAAIVSGDYIFAAGLGDWRLHPTQQDE